MAEERLQVTLAPDGFYPRSLRWQGRTIRVLYVEETYTRGLERRYRVRTPEGTYELGLHASASAWRMRRSPAWRQRLWLRVQQLPRYPAPLGRRRGGRQAALWPPPTERCSRSSDRALWPVSDRATPRATMVSSSGSLGTR